MSHENRARITVQLGATSLLNGVVNLPGWDQVGLVTADEETGALVVNKRTGVYAMTHGTSIRCLDQRKVKAALGIRNNAGRPTALEDAKRVNVYLDAASLERAAELGGGNVSEGIRIALCR